METTEAGFWDDAELISVYTRAQAIEDGFLIDVSSKAREAGFRLPVAMTAAAWEDCVAWPEGSAMQDESGRLWDVVWMAMLGASRNQQRSEFIYDLLRVPKGRRKAMRTQLKCCIGAGDAGEAVCTIMLPTED